MSLTTTLTAGLAFTAGLIAGVALAEANVLSCEDLKQAGKYCMDKCSVAGRAIKTKYEQESSTETHNTIA